MTEINTEINTEADTGTPSPTTIAVAQAMHARLYPEQNWLADNTDEERDEWLALAEAAVAKLGPVALVAEPVAPRAPIERKVLWGGLGTLAAGLTVAALEWAQGGGLSAIPGLPSWVGAAVTVAAPTLLGVLAAWAAPHTERPDLAGGA